MASTDAQQAVIAEYARLVAHAYNTAKAETKSEEIAGVVASQVASMLVPPTIQDYARALAARPTIQVAPKLLAS